MSGSNAPVYDPSTGLSFSSASVMAAYDNSISAGGGVYSLLNPDTYIGTGTGSTANVTETPSAQSSFATFLTNSFATVDASGNSQFNAISNDFNTWAGYNSSFQNAVGSAFAKVVNNSDNASGSGYASDAIGVLGLALAFL